MTSQEKKQLQITACKVRMGIIESTYCAKCGHPGGSLSVWTALWQYVVPFILPDGVKLALALLLSKKLRTIV